MGRDCSDLLTADPPPGKAIHVHLGGSIVIVAVTIVVRR
jgi:hypothetical protein